MLSFERVFAFLPNLTESQLKKVQERVDFLVTAKLGTKEDKLLDLFYSAVLTSLKVYYSRTYPRHPISLKLSFPKIHKLLLKSYKEFSESLVAVLERKPIVEEFIRASYIFTEMIAEDLTKRNIRPSLQAIFTNTSSFPLLLERNFPGYVSAGAAHFIFEGLDRFDRKKLKVEKDSKEV